MRTSNSMTFWEIFIFQDFSMTALFSGFSMTVGTLLKHLTDWLGVSTVELCG